MKISLTFADSISGVLNAITGLEQSEFSFVRADSPSTVVGFDFFQEIGDGQYEFGDFDLPDWSFNQGTGQGTLASVVVLPRINGVIQEGFSEIPVWNNTNSVIVSTDLYAREDRFGDTHFGRKVWDPSLSAVLGYDAFNPTQDQYYRFTVPVIGWVKDTISASLSAVSISGLSAYMPLSGGSFSGPVTFNTTTVNAVGTKFNLQGATADLNKLTVSSLNVNNGSYYQFLNLGTVQTGDHFTYGFQNTDQENVPVFTMGCDGGEIPYVNFHNRQIFGFNINNSSISASLSAYMPTAGGVFTGSVTANGPRFNLGTTKVNGQSASADFKNITTSALTSYNGALTASSVSATQAFTSDLFLGSLIAGTESLSDGSGTRTVTTAKCRSNSLVFLTPYSPLGTPGHLYLADVSNGTFTVVSSNGGADDNLLFHWFIVNR